MSLLDHHPHHFAELLHDSGTALTIRANVLLASVAETLGLLQPHLAEEQRGRGVFICMIMRVCPTFSVLRAPVGRIFVPKGKRYYDLSEEKAQRTLLNAGHYLSWESRDDSIEHFQGGAASAVRSIGASGLPSEMDEVIAINGLVDMGDITRTEADLIARISSNSIYNLLYPAAS